MRRSGPSRSPTRSPPVDRLDPLLGSNSRRVESEKSMPGAPVLDRTFAALADPTRRAILERLSDADRLTVSDLAAPFAMSLPAVLKHVGVLADAGLVAREKIGRVVYCRIETSPLRAALKWLALYDLLWSGRSEVAAKQAEPSAGKAPPAARRATPGSKQSPRKPVLKPGRKAVARKDAKPQPPAKTKTKTNTKASRSAVTPARRRSSTGIRGARRRR